MTMQRDETPEGERPVHMIITRRVKAGCEDAFLAGLKTFFKDSFGHVGVLGASMVVPPPGSTSREFGILRTFASVEDRDAFYESTLFKEWEVRSAALTEGGTSYRELTGMEAWFRSPQRPPARWKMALLTWVAVWSVSLAMRALLALIFGDRAPAWLFSAVSTAGVVALLTWVVMPRLVKLCGRWLGHATQPALGPERSRLVEK